MQGRKLTDAERARIIRLARDMPIKAIVRFTGYDRGAIRRVLRANQNENRASGA